MTEASGARFWAVDLHTHTPASQDVNEKAFGATTPEEVVQAALDAHVDAIAVTDHNTSAWCDAVAEAAVGKDLIVLPGVEISTTEGHLLAIWEEGTPSTTVNEVLVRLGIMAADQGKLDIAAEVGLADAAQVVAESNGLAIAAHVDRPKGLLKLSVAAQVKRTMLNPSLGAVEIVETETEGVVANKVGSARTLACIRGSDSTLPGKSIHVVTGVGSRRTWIKATRPDLVGIVHALKDPDLRVRLKESETESAHPFIESVKISGAFLNEYISLSSDLNCLLGGTGAGKSLVLESIRYALDQQVDPAEFPGISDEVQSRLAYGLGNTGVISLVVNADTDRYLIERSFSDGLPSPPVVRQQTGSEWTDVDIHPSDVISLAAFSQGEILEFSRQPVGRMSLLDSGIDFGDLSVREERVLDDLRSNGRALIAQRSVVQKLRERIVKESETADRVTELSALFDTEAVKQQEGWKKESARLTKFADSVPSLDSDQLTVPDAAPSTINATNTDIFDQVEDIRAVLADSVSAGVTQITEAIRLATEKVGAIRKAWDERFEAFKAVVDEELAKVKDGASLVVLRTQLEQLQEELLDIRSKKTELTATAVPALESLVSDRDRLLGELKDFRDERRRLRRERAVQLNAKTAGIAKLDISTHPDHSAFRAALEGLKTGSRVKEDVLKAIATHIHPFRLARCLLDGDLQTLVDAEAGIDLSSLARLQANLDDRALWDELLEAQICDVPDRLDIKFRKPDDGAYAHIEQLAHGQRCTAILVVLLADGLDPRSGRPTGGCTSCTLDRGLPGGASENSSW
jgi:hypothetical protein